MNDSNNAGKNELKAIPVHMAIFGARSPSRKADKPMVDLKKFWSSLLADADIIDYRIHDNRHTHASQLVSSGMNLAIVGRLLGQTNPMTKQRYAHIAYDPLREAAEVMATKTRG
ncbi:MAG: tyrosine-type recombinase/integrase [Paracoccaceae bacterium]